MNKVYEVYGWNEFAPIDEATDNILIMIPLPHLMHYIDKKYNAVKIGNHEYAASMILYLIDSEGLTEEADAFSDSIRGEVTRNLEAMQPGEEQTIYDIKVKCWELTD